MKILIINTVWTGASTGKIAYGFFSKLKENGNECKLLYGIGEINTADENVICINKKFDQILHGLINQITGYHGRFMPFTMKNIIRIIEGFAPDIVQLYNLHGNFIDIYRLFDYLKEKKIPIVYSMLDEHPYLGYCCYAFECSQFISGCQCCKKDFKKDYPRSLFYNRAKETVLLKAKAYSNDEITFVGPKWVLERAEKSFLLKGKKMEEVDEYIDTEKTFVIKEVERLRRELGIGNNQIVILNVAPYSDIRKGVRYFLQLAKEMVNSNYLFINVGYDGSEELLPSNFIGIPFVKDQALLAEYYSLADLFVCTSLADTMPNVCLDALACGTPVVGFNITGVPYVAEEPLGRFVEAGNVLELKQIVSGTKKKDSELQNMCREYALRRYSLNTYYNKMINIYKMALLGEE